MMEKNYISVDIETTGLSPVKDKIIEIGAVKVVDGKVVDYFQTLVDPQMALRERIVELTGLTDEMVIGKDTIERAMEQFLAFAQELPLLGHNILFDYSFLKTAASKQKLAFERKGIDTLLISRRLHEELSSKTLDSMCAYYGIQNEHHHRALEDAIATMQLYEKLSMQKEATEKILAAKPLFYRPKKFEPAMPRQKKMLIDLLKYHKIEIRQSIDTMTKSEASRTIDKILSQYGRMSDESKLSKFN